MSAEYRRRGISFQYPENWELDEDNETSGPQAITVMSPGGGFWSVSIHPTSTDPEALAAAAVEAMRDDYADLECEPASEILAGHEMLGYDMRFWYLDLTSTAGVRCVRTNQATYVVFFQAEDREFDRIELVFAAMTTSFLKQAEPSEGRF